jgi:hypothetical protein
VETRSYFGTEQAEIAGLGIQARPHHAQLPIATSVGLSKPLLTLGELTQGCELFFILFYFRIHCVSFVLTSFLLFLGIGLGQEFIPAPHRQRRIGIEEMATQESYGMLYSSIGSWLDILLIVTLLQRITAPRPDMTR